MAKYISNELANLIRERAYTKGDLSRLERDESEALAIFVHQRQRIRDIRQQRKVVLARIGVLDAEITKQIPVDPANIRPIRSTPKSGLKKGSIVSAIVRVLVASPTAVPTPDIVQALVSKFGWAYGSDGEKDIARRKVVQPLRVLVKKGAVQRLHDTTKNDIGLWMWVGL